MKTATISRVTEYLIKKALAQDIPAEEQALLRATGRPLNEIQAVLREMFPAEFPDVIRTSATIPELAVYAKPLYDTSGKTGILDYEYQGHACCCMGPQGSEPLCPCAMQAALFRNREEVAEFLESENSVEVSRQP